MKTPIITIIGRPNVGKSTFFNKIAGRRIAITAEESGTTRDRIFHKVKHSVMDFFLVDTGGLEFGKGQNTIEDDMQTQSRIAMEESDLILFLVDSKTALMDQDYKAAEILRSKQLKKPVFLIANKCDHVLNEIYLARFYELGLGEPYQVSALHKTGIEMILDQVIETLKKRHFITKNDPDYSLQLKEEKKHPNIAMVGKPNVGKSSLINALLNKEKLIVSDIAGTTRDSTDSLVKYDGRFYNFVDTAGLKRPGKTGKGIEHFSALRSMTSIERADIALLVLDTSQAISHQDQQIANYILQAGTGLIIIANKWDIDKKKGSEEVERRSQYIRSLKHKFPFLSWAPVIFTSAITKKNLSPIFEQIELALEERKKRIQTSRLNQFVQQLMQSHPPTGKTRTIPKIYYITQAERQPPTFIVFVNKKQAFHFSYLRYLENRFREKFGFMGTPIRLDYKEKENDRKRGERKNS